MTAGTPLGPARIRPAGCTLYLLPVQTRTPYQFGRETLEHVLCARVHLRCRGADGREVDGWGETPLGVGWAWPSQRSFAEREAAMVALCRDLAAAWVEDREPAHPLRLGHDLLEHRLPALVAAHAGMPRLAGLVCAAPFDLALHDAYGRLLGRSSFRCYGRDCCDEDLASFLGPDFAGQWVADHLVSDPPTRIPAWHAVGAGDPLTTDDRDGSEPDDAWPTTLVDWIRRDGLGCLKVKLRGDDPAWDYQRLVRVGAIAREYGCRWLCADFNCTVSAVDTVVDHLDRLLHEHPDTWQRLLYVEQPFPYDLERHPWDVHAIAARKPLLMDESAHDWRLIRRGRALGWSGVALKTCKTLTGALLGHCWARHHGMSVMVQDLTNPMLAQVAHVGLAANVGTLWGCESNGMQFYPAASAAEAAVHPGLYDRRPDGHLDLSTLGPTGLGYRVDEIARTLPAPAAEL